MDTEKNAFASRLGIQSIPTFFFYVKGNKVDEMKGADPMGLEGKVIQHKVERKDAASSFGGKGVTLGSSSSATWDGVGLPPGDNARAARLRAFGALDAKPSSLKEEKVGKEEPMEISSSNDQNEEDRLLAQALKLSQADDKAPKVPNPSSSSSSKQDALDDAEAEAAVAAEMRTQQHNVVQGSQDWGEDMVPLPVDETLLKELLEMGFADARSRKAIYHGKDLEGALTWLDQHQDDADIDQPYMVRKSEIRAPLTKEELAARTAAMKLKIVELRKMKEREEKNNQLKQEKERRERGQKMGETQEERDRMMRKREAEKIKKEKEAEKKERERLRAEIARDKELRKANKGVLPSVLGIDGYNPSIVNYNESSMRGEEPPAGTVEGEAAIQPMNPTVVPVSSSSSSSSSGTPSKVASSGGMKKSVESTSSDSRRPEEVIDSSIETISRYRTGGDGSNALKLLLTFVKNIVENPSEPK